MSEMNTFATQYDLEITEAEENYKLKIEEATSLFEQARAKYAEEYAAKLAMAKERFEMAHAKLLERQSLDVAMLNTRAVRETPGAHEVRFTQEQSQQIVDVLDQMTKALQSGQ